MPDRTVSLTADEERTIAREAEKRGAPVTVQQVFEAIVRAALRARHDILRQEAVDLIRAQNQRPTQATIDAAKAATSSQAIRDQIDALFGP